MKYYSDRKMFHVHDLLLCQCRFDSIILMRWNWFLFKIRCRCIPNKPVFTQRALPRLETWNDFIFSMNFSDSVRIINLIQNCILTIWERSMKFQISINIYSALWRSFMKVIRITKNVFGSKTVIDKRCRVPNAQF